MLGYQIGAQQSLLKETNTVVPTISLSSQDYSYWSIDEPCNALREGRKVVSIDSYEDVPSNSEPDLEKAVAAQPVSVAICASDLQFYSTGRFTVRGSTESLYQTACILMPCKCVCALVHT